MMLNTSIQYAIVIITFIRNDPMQLVPAAKIAKELNLSAMYVDQILRKLKRGGFIDSNRGPGGGYKLTDKQVTIYDLMVVLTHKKNKTMLHGAIQYNGLVNGALNAIVI